MKVSLFTILFGPEYAGLIGYVIWGLSLVMLGLVIKYFIDIRRANILPVDVQQQVQERLEQKEYRDVIDMTAEEPSYFSYLMHAALTEAAHGYPAMERAMEEAAEERTAKMLRGIEWLNLIGNISPMLGLMGTVWGMIGAFFGIVEAGGTPEPAKLATSIGQALVTTLLGLAVAIPSLMVYGIMRNRIDSLTSEAMVSSQELISTFRPGAGRKNA